ncbi:hypothetical protein N657DRAFT_473159 [Parathielavia appendiculata]|uniref:Uncharacterized protein n=1 Tax=Parathielavia appendiculata TaxID=2587402 RepID=A0AAN6TYU8_9PEZI|nr:hypothetical protein N657DRAFT_473159 [Parathielavia appendiculata]
MSGLSRRHSWIGSISELHLRLNCDSQTSQRQRVSAIRCPCTPYRTPNNMSDTCIVRKSLVADFDSLNRLYPARALGFGWEGGGAREDGKSCHNRPRSFPGARPRRCGPVAETTWLDAPMHDHSLCQGNIAHARGDGKAMKVRHGILGPLFRRKLLTLPLLFLGTAVHPPSPRDNGVTFDGISPNTAVSSHSLPLPSASQNEKEGEYPACRIGSLPSTR